MRPVARLVGCTADEPRTPQARLARLMRAGHVQPGARRLRIDADGECADLAADGTIVPPPEAGAAVTYGGLGLGQLEAAARFFGDLPPRPPCAADLLAGAAAWEVCVPRDERFSLAMRCFGVLVQSWQSSLGLEGQHRDAQVYDHVEARAP